MRKNLKDARKRLGLTYCISVALRYMQILLSVPMKFLRTAKRRLVLNE